MAVQLIPLASGSELAALWVTALAASKLRLLGAGFMPQPSDVAATCIAGEAAFSGYTAGGYALATWLPPVFNPQGGASISSPQVNPSYVAPESDPVAGIVSGWFLLDAAGNLIGEGLFDNQIGMSQNGDGFPITVTLYVGTTNQLVTVTVYGQEQGG